MDGTSVRQPPFGMDEANLLRRIRGEDVGRALNTLPACESTIATEIETVIDVPELGRVRITFTRFVQKRGKLRREFWNPQRAMRIFE